MTKMTSALVLAAVAAAALSGPVAAAPMVDAKLVAVGTASVAGEDGALILVGNKPPKGKLKKVGKHLQSS